MRDTLNEGSSGRSVYKKVLVDPDEVIDTERIRVSAI
jgi:hypothetical protein